MTAPLDIGLEQHDDALRHGQDDIFDLDGVLRRNGATRLGDEMDEDESDEDREAAGDDGNGGDDMLDEEEERERKVSALEEELDGMYDSYQVRMKERDAKYKVQEARKNDKAREEWGGIRQQGSDDEDESEEEGGWEETQARKARADEDSDSSDSDEDEKIEVQQTSKKRRREAGPVEVGKAAKKARVDPKGSGKEANGPAQLSRAAQVWFSQDFFKSAGLSDVEDDDEDMEGQPDEESDVDMAEEDTNDKPEAVSSVDG